MVENTIGSVPRRGPGRPPNIASKAPELKASDSSPALVSDGPFVVGGPFISDAPSLVPEQAPPRPGRVRKPFGSQSQKLARAPRPGYHRHWFNDTPGRLLRAQEAGYEFVNKGASAENGWRGTSNERDSHPVGVTEGGGALMAYLMEIPEEWYKEDMAAEQARIDELERAIKRGADDQGAPGKDGRYIPSMGIKITHGRG